MAYTGNGAFGGLDARRAAADGAIRDMENMSLRFSPAIATRLGRRWIATNYKDYGGAYFLGDRAFVVRDKGLYDGSKKVCDVSAGEKQMAILGDKLYVFPDKIEYDITNKTYKNRGVKLSNVGNGKSAWISWGWSETGGDVSSITFKTEFITLEYADFPDVPFKTGDRIFVEIQGPASQTKYEYGVVVESVATGSTDSIPGYSWYIRVPMGTFLAAVGNPSTIEAAVKITIRYDIPDIDFVFASDNRLWGAKGREIYASALGQGMVWTDYDTLTTSSWAATTKTGDNITAALDFGGMPVFFAENAAYKIYGENPKEFQYVRQELIGVTAGDHKSVTVGAGYIFFQTRRGIYAWTGGVPQLISAPLGEERIKNAVGGSDGVVYYLSCKQDGRQNLYVFDPMTFAWVREDDAEAVDIKQKGRDLCLVATDGNVYLIGDVYSTEGTEIQPERYFFETADYNDGAVVQKSAKNILVQYELTDGEADVMVSYDGEPWNHVYTLYDTDGKKITSVIPLQEKRYRTMRIRIEGDGEIVIYYIVRDVNVRTERPGGERNVYV